MTDLAMSLPALFGYLILGWFGLALLVVLFLNITDQDEPTPYTDIEKAANGWGERCDHCGVPTTDSLCDDCSYSQFMSEKGDRSRDERLSQ